MEGLHSSARGLPLKFLGLATSLHIFSLAAAEPHKIREFHMTALDRRTLMAATVADIKSPPSYLTSGRGSVLSLSRRAVRTSGPTVPSLPAQQLAAILQ